MRLMPRFGGVRLHLVKVTTLGPKELNHLSDWRVVELQLRVDDLLHLLHYLGMVATQRFLRPDSARAFLGKAIGGNTSEYNKPEKTLEDFHGVS
jgi:hypothetical protein